MDKIVTRAAAIGQRRVARVVDALADTAAAELPADLAVERQADGIAITGPGLARRMAFDARLRGLTLVLKETAR